MKRFIFIALICATGLILNAQTTVTFKPNATIGEDATLFMMDDGCIPLGWTNTPADLNYGNAPGLSMLRWTYNANECPYGKTRQLLRFSQLNNIPQNAIILSAVLKLYGDPTSQNTWFPGHPDRFFENNVDVYLVNSPWSENMVTWNTQPAVSTSPIFSIPVSTSQYSWNYTNGNITNIIQNMVSVQNYGFMFRLQNEIEEYRSMCFVSSDHSNPALWPELIITYVVCDANFTYCLDNTNNPYDYTFTSLNPNNPYHQWTINGQIVSYNSSFQYHLPPGIHKVCYFTDMKYDKCEKCIEICVAENPKSDIELKVGETVEPSNLPIQGRIPEGDVVGEESNIIIYPNPTKNNWNLKINSLIEDSIEISISNMEGNQIYLAKQTLQKGINNIILGNDSYNKGIYVLSIKGEVIDYSQKIVKE